MSWREDLAKSNTTVCIMGPDFYQTNAPEILAQAMCLEKAVILVVPQDRDVPIPPQFGTYAGLKARIDIPTFDPVVIMEKVREQAQRWGFDIASGYEHTWEDLPGPS